MTGVSSPSAVVLLRGALIGGRYAVDCAIQSSVPWAEYLAIDTVGGRRVIVEARPTGVSDHTLDSAAALDVSRSGDGATTYVVREFVLADAGGGQPSGTKEAPLPANAPTSRDQVLASGFFLAGRYTIEEFLGRGGSGVVYRAVDTLLDRPVALKVVDIPRLDPGDSRDLRRRVLSEARFVSKLRHPHIVEFLQASEYEGNLLLSLELCSGGSLRHRLGEASPVQRETWLLQIAEGLAYAHTARIVHRDVKPENIVVDDTGAAKLTDFGIARALAATGAHCTTSIVGTPRYMAPEQLLGEPQDARVDQYAWGMVAYEAFTGGVLSPAAERSDAAFVRAGVPPAFAPTLRRALDPSPDARFASMSDLLESVGARGTWWHLRSTRWYLCSAAVVALVALAIAGKSVLARSRGDALQPDNPGFTSPAPRSGREVRSSEAEAAFRAGTQLWHDASLMASRDKFEVAATIDPLCAEAHLRFVLASEWMEPPVRGHLLRATELRSSLSEADQRLLAAVTPSVLDPSKYGQTVNELLRLSSEGTSSTDLEATLALRLVHVDRLDAALEHTRRLSELSGGSSALARGLEARVGLRRGDAAATRKGIDDCLALAPSAMDCLDLAATTHVNGGDCEEAARYARRQLASYPDRTEGYLNLAAALYCLRRPVGEVRTVLEQRWARLKAEDRPLRECRDEGALAVMVGDFAKADRALATCETASPLETDAYLHAFPRDMRIDIQLELGNTRRAAELARAFVRASVTWSTDEAWDTRFEGFKELRKTGALAKGAFARQRNEWLSKAPSGDHYYASEAVRWFDGYADAMVDAADAVEAVLHMPQTRPFLDEELLDVGVAQIVGDALLRGGQAEEALPYMERASRGGSVFRTPAVVRALAALGSIREAKGERAAACKAYLDVISRWPVASGSLTSRRASQRISALKCHDEQGG